MLYVLSCIIQNVMDMQSENIVLWDSQAGQMKSDETVLVTAAAGGTGQFAVQVYKILNLNL